MLQPHCAIVAFCWSHWRLVAAGSVVVMIMIVVRITIIATVIISTITNMQGLRSVEQPPDLEMIDDDASDMQKL